MDNTLDASKLYELITNIRNIREIKYKYLKKDCPETSLHVKAYDYLYDDAYIDDKRNLFIICGVDFDVVSKIMIDICTFSSHNISIFYDTHTCLLKTKYKDVNNYIVFCYGTDIGDALQLFSSTPGKIMIKYVNISSALKNDEEYKNFKDIFYKSLYPLLNTKEN